MEETTTDSLKRPPPEGERQDTPPKRAKIEGLSPPPTIATQSADNVQQSPHHDLSQSDPSVKTETSFKQETQSLDHDNQVTTPSAANNTSSAVATTTNQSVPSIPPSATASVPAVAQTVQADPLHSSSTTTLAAAIASVLNSQASPVSTPTPAPITQATQEQHIPPPESQFAEPITSSVAFTPTHALYAGQINVPEPLYRLRLRNLAVLDDLANQILDWAQDSTSNDLLSITDHQNEPSTHAWKILCSTFEGVKTMYGVNEGYLSFSSITSQEPIDADSLRRANLAAAVMNLINPGPYSFMELQKHFWFLFCPPGNEPKQWHADAFLEITARAYASHIQMQHPELADRPVGDVAFDALITRDVQSQIRARLPPIRQADGSERDRPYVKMLFVRCHEIQRLLARSDPISLHRDYRVKGILRTLGHKLKVEIRPTFQMSHILQPPIVEARAYQQAHGPAATSPHSVNMSQQPPPPHHQSPASHHHQQRPANNELPEDDDNDLLRQAAMAAAASLQRGTSARAASQPSEPTPSATPVRDNGHQPPRHDAEAIQAAAQTIVNNATEASQNSLYGDAAMAKANARQQAAAAVADSQRRPWTQEEENALMEGLDRVKGPHWSQILAMYGPGGTVSEVLKNRTQVQLKDKARNLKLFFLKNNQDVPEYLRHVTGELKTRAPMSAASRAEGYEEAGSRLEDFSGSEMLDLAALANFDPNGGTGDGGNQTNGGGGGEGAQQGKDGAGGEDDMADAVKMALASVARNGGLSADAISALTSASK